MSMIYVNEDSMEYITHYDSDNRIWDQEMLVLQDDITWDIESDDSADSFTIEEMKQASTMWLDEIQFTLFACKIAQVSRSARAA
eukprot:299661-Ditylum_brightwellii.AAC.1